MGAPTHIPWGRRVPNTELLFDIISMPWRKQFILQEENEPWNILPYYTFIYLKGILQSCLAITLLLVRWFGLLNKTPYLRGLNISGFVSFPSIVRMCFTFPCFQPAAVLTQTLLLSNNKLSTYPCHFNFSHIFPACVSSILANCYLPSPLPQACGI